MPTGYHNETRALVYTPRDYGPKPNPIERLQPHSITGDGILLITLMVKSHCCPTPLQWCSPGSVPGPTLLCLYTNKLGQIIDKHEITHQQFVDDSYLYMCPNTALFQSALLKWNVAEVMLKPGCCHAN